MFAMFTEVLIGLEQTAYTTNEGESVEVCAAIFSPEEIDPNLIAIAMLTAVPGTADGMSKQDEILEHVLVHGFL